VIRNRFRYFLIALLLVLVGLGSRKYGVLLPKFLAEYAGDTLWAALVFVGIGFVMARSSTLRVLTVALASCYTVEISQLYHAPWIDNLRHTTLGGLVLGFGFLWSDLVCYTTGVVFAAIIEVAALNNARMDQAR
jgi:hypothetical protein